MQLYRAGQSDMVRTMELLREVRPKANVPFQTALTGSSVSTRPGFTVVLYS